MLTSLTTAGNKTSHAKSWSLHWLVFFTPCIFLLLPLHALAQVTFPAQTVGSSGGSNPTIAHTSPAGANTLLVVTTTANEGAEPTSVTWNGSEGLTLLRTYQFNGIRAGIWYRVNPTSGNHNVTSTGGNVQWWSVKTFHGVDQTNPFDSPADTNVSNGEGPNPSVSITTTADNMTTEVVSYEREESTVSPTNGNSVEDSDSWPQDRPHGADSHTDDSGSISVGWNDTDGNPWVMIVADILAAPPATGMYYWQQDTGTSVAGFTTNSTGCGSSPENVYLITLMTSSGFNCANIRHQGTAGVPQNLWLMIKDTPYAGPTRVRASTSR